MTGDPTSLFLFLHDSPPEWEDELNRYFDFDHLPDRISCAGWGRAERFEKSAVEPVGPAPTDRATRYLYFHELDSLDALTSDARGSYGASPWARAQREEPGPVPVAPTRGHRTAWRRRPSPWQGAQVFHAPPPRALLVVMRDVAPGHAVEANRFLDEVLVPEVLGCPGFLRCERYEAGPELPSTPGSPEFAPPSLLDVFDVASPEVLTSEVYRTRAASPAREPDDVRAHLTTRLHAVYVQRPSPWAVGVIDAGARTTARDDTSRGVGPRHN
jgi:hypothetical protein